MFQGNECLRSLSCGGGTRACFLLLLLPRPIVVACPRDLGPNAAGRCVAAFCWGSVALERYRHILASPWALPDDLAHVWATLDNPLTLTLQLLPCITCSWDSCALASK